jgi:hypothetical protein
MMLDLAEYSEAYLHRDTDQTARPPGQRGTGRRLIRGYTLDFAGVVPEPIGLVFRASGFFP